MKITYHIDYQYKQNSFDRPLPEGDVINTSGEETPVMFLPSVGDYVEISGDPENKRVSSFSGVVTSRYFRYRRLTVEEVFCHINIVVEQTSHDPDTLLNE